MTEQLQVFENEEFGQVRVLETEGQPWFVGKDVTKNLGYRNHNDAMIKHVDAEDKGVANCDTLGGRQKLAVINESGLYSLILSSKLPSAKRFKRWVTTEVLPSIRKHGAYIMEELLKQLDESREYALELIGKLDAERRKFATLRRATAELAPKAAYCETILGCGNAIPVSLIAKEYGMSAAAFNRLLCGVGVQYRVAGTWLPYQKYAGKGYTKTRTVRIGERVAALYTCWTQAGRMFLYERLRECGIEPLTSAGLRTVE